PPPATTSFTEKSPTKTEWTPPLIPLFFLLSSPSSISNPDVNSYPLLLHRRPLRPGVRGLRVVRLSGGFCPFEQENGSRLGRPPSPRLDGDSDLRRRAARLSA